MERTREPSQNFRFAVGHNWGVKLPALLLVAVRLFAQSPDSAAVDAIVHDALAASHTPGAGVAIVKEDRVVYLKGHGAREQGRSDSVTSASLFSTASLTKPFTPTSIPLL